MRQSFLETIVLGLLGLAVASLATPASAAYEDCRAKTVAEGLEEHKTDLVAGYTIRVSSYFMCLESSRLDVIKDGRPVLTLLGDRLDIYDVAKGADITGNGIPDMVVVDWTGGAHCCFYFHVVELGSNPRVVTLIEARHSNEPPIEDLDGEPGMEFVFGDWTFEYYRAAFIGSPIPRVVLHLTPNGVRTATNVMRAPVDEAVLWQRQMRFREEALETGVFTPDLMSWGVRDLTLDLVYSGHWDRAMRYFNETWPTSLPAEKPDNLDDLICQMRKSRFWPDVAAMNGIPVETGADRCPKEWPREQSSEMAGFDIKIKRVSDENSRAEISRAGNLILQLRGTHFTMVHPSPFDHAGSGAPRIVVRDQDDEKHDKGKICFFTFYLIELDVSARAIATTRAPHYDPPPIGDWSNPQCGGEVARPDG